MTDCYANSLRSIDPTSTAFRYLVDTPGKPIGAGNSARQPVNLRKVRDVVGKIAIILNGGVRARSNRPLRFLRGECVLRAF